MGSCSKEICSHLASSFPGGTTDMDASSKQINSGNPYEQGEQETNDDSEKEWYDEYDGQEYNTHSKRDASRGDAAKGNGTNRSSAASFVRGEGNFLLTLFWAAAFVCI